MLTYKLDYPDQEIESRLKQKQNSYLKKRDVGINRFRGTWEFCKGCGKVYRQEPEVTRTEADGTQVVLEKIELCRKCFRKEVKHEKHIGYVRDVVARGLVLPEDSLHLLSGLMSQKHFDEKVKHSKNEYITYNNQERDDFTPKGVNFWQTN